MQKSNKYTGVWLNHLSNNDISYYVQLRDENGKNKRIKIGKRSEGINEVYCKNKRNELINKIRFGEDDLLFKNLKGPTVDEVVKLYLEDLKIRGKKETNIFDIKRKYELHIQEYIGARALKGNSIDVDTLEKLKSDKLKTLYPVTVNNILILISSIIKFGNKKLDLDAVNNIANGKVAKFVIDNQRERFLSKEEVELLLEHTKPYKNTDLATRFGLSLGARISTILSIQAKDIDTVNRTVKLFDHKNNSSYVGFLHEKYFPDFNFLKGLKANDYVISSKGSGKKVTKNAIQFQFRKVADSLFNEELDINERKHRVVFHTLRHTYCSLLVSADVPIYTVQKLANHKDIQSTMRYSKISHESLHESVKMAFA